MIFKKKPLSLCLFSLPFKGIFETLLDAVEWEHFLLWYLYRQAHGSSMKLIMPFNCLLQLHGRVYLMFFASSAAVSVPTALLQQGAPPVPPAVGLWPIS